MKFELLGKEALKLYNNKYFDYVVTVTCLSLAFICGRLLN